MLQKYVFVVVQLTSLGALIIRQNVKFRFHSVHFSLSVHITQHLEQASWIVFQQKSPSVVCFSSLFQDHARTTVLFVYLKVCPAVVKRQGCIC